MWKPFYEEMQGVPARWGDPARGPTLLDPAQAEEHHEPGPLPPFEPGPPLLAGTPPPPAPLWEGARGKGSRLERGSGPVAFSNCERFGRGNTTSRVPPTSRDPLSLLILVLAKFFKRPVREKDPPVRGTDGPVRGTDPPVTGTGGLLIVESAFNCNGSPYGFNCVGSRAGLLRNGRTIGPQLA